jgi:hypothetical protein
MNLYAVSIADVDPRERQQLQPVHVVMLFHYGTLDCSLKDDRKDLRVAVVSHRACVSNKTYHEDHFVAGWGFPYSLVPLRLRCSTLRTIGDTFLKEWLACEVKRHTQLRGDETTRVEMCDAQGVCMVGSKLPVRSVVLTDKKRPSQRVYMHAYVMHNQPAIKVANNTDSKVADDVWPSVGWVSVPSMAPLRCADLPLQDKDVVDAYRFPVRGVPSETHGPGPVQNVRMNGFSLYLLSRPRVRIVLDKLLRAVEKMVCKP